jgi:hypothetical protein
MLPLKFRQAGLSREEHRCPMAVATTHRLMAFEKDVEEDFADREKARLVLSQATKKPTFSFSFFCCS